MWCGYERKFWSEVSSSVVTVGLRPIFRIWDLGLRGECPGILSRIYASFGENHEKLRKARSTSATED